MRAVSLVLIAGFLSLATVSAEAMTISPNPVNETRSASAPGGTLNANLSAVSVSGNVATFQLSVVTGSVTGIDVGMLLNSLSAPTAFNMATGATFAGTGIGGTSAVVSGVAQFDFTGVIGAGQSSRQLVVTFASPVAVSYFGSVNFDNGFITTKTYQVIPEPMTLALAGLALGGLSALRRRRV